MSGGREMGVGRIERNMSGKWGEGLSGRRVEANSQMAEGKECPK